MNAVRWLMGAGVACLLFSAEVGAGPGDPLANLSTEEQFLSTLRMRQEQNQWSIRQSDQSIRLLEHRLDVTQAEAERRERELSGLNTMPAPTPGDEMRQSEARHSARMELERARMERERLAAELERRQRDRVELMQDGKKLLRLESEYETDPGRAGDLLDALQ